MEIPDATNLTSMARYLVTGTNGLMFDFLLLPIFFIIVLAYSNNSNNDPLDGIISASLICLGLSMILASIQLTSIVSVGVLTSILIISLVFKKFL